MPRSSAVVRHLLDGNLDIHGLTDDEEIVDQVQDLCQTGCEPVEAAALVWYRCRQLGDAVELAVYAGNVCAHWWAEAATAKGVDPADVPQIVNWERVSAALGPSWDAPGVDESEE